MRLRSSPNKMSVGTCRTTLRKSKRMVASSALPMAPAGLLAGNAGLDGGRGCSWSRVASAPLLLLPPSFSFLFLPATTSQPGSTPGKRHNGCHPSLIDLYPLTPVTLTTSSRFKSLKKNR